MLKIQPMLLLSLAIILTATHAQADGYYSFGISKGGKSNDSGAIFEIGINHFEMDDTTWLIAGGVAITQHNNIPSTTKKGQGDHAQLPRLKKEEDGTETGFYTKIGRRLKSSKLFVTLHAGLSMVNETELVRSASTQTTYALGTARTFRPLIGVGISYYPEPQFDWDVRFNVHADFDIRHGFILSGGWCW